MYGGTFAPVIFGGKGQKNPRAHKNKIGSPPPPPKNPKYPPPLKRGILWTWFFLQKERIFPGVHKIDAPISGPRIADKNFTDTRIFLRRENDPKKQGKSENKISKDWRVKATGQESAEKCSEPFPSLRYPSTPPQDRPPGN